MFRKKDNYDDYNEKASSKYDDDYIREEKEYNEECRHSHEQTYKDCDDGQKEYYKSERPRDRFAGEIGHDEIILWCGKAEKKANATETGVGNLGCVGWFMAGVATFLILSKSLTGFVILLFLPKIFSSCNVKNRTYAITDKRVITLRGRKFTSFPLDKICNVKYSASSRDIGYVTFGVKTKVKDSSMEVMINHGIYAIAYPENAYKKLNKAIAEIKQGSVNNG